MSRSGEESTSRENSDSSAVSRRRYLGALSAATAMGIAGCGQQDGNGNGNGNGGGGQQQELGERVPTITLAYWSNLGGLTSTFETVTKITKENLEQRLGVTVNVKPMEVAAQLNGNSTDTRPSHAAYWFHSNDPTRLDPTTQFRWHSLMDAGNTGRLSPSHYASCEFTDPAIKQERATSEEERKELAHEAQSVFSQDMANIPIMPSNEFYAIRTDMMELPNPGDAGFSPANTQTLADAVVKDGNAVITNTDSGSIEQRNFSLNGNGVKKWSHLVNSTLTEYGRNYELESVVAENYEYTDDGRTLTVTLRDGATFHNGDPVTSEDVKFTFDYIDQNAEAIPLAAKYPIKSIETTDEKTTVFNFEKPTLSMVRVGFARWGILRKEDWEPAMEDPQGFEWKSMIGSGPYRVDSFTPGQQLTLKPFDNHPVYEPNAGLTYKVYRNAQTIQQALESRELSVATNLSTGALDQLEKSLGDKVKTYTRAGTQFYQLYPQTHIAPFKFRVLRNAAGKAINRQEISQVALQGRAEPVLFSNIWPKSHPFTPSDDMLTKFVDNPAGDEEAARQALRDAGWGWDNNGKLHYPPDADTSPKWPKKERPDPSEYPCIDSEYNWVPPEER